MFKTPKRVSKSGWLLVTLALAASCGGNYSNEDLEFQVALPPSNQLQASTPQALVLAGSAEYYTLTRQAVTVFNAMVTGVITLVDTVRAVPATTRAPALRVWGPFPDKDHPGWAERIQMMKVSAPDVVGFGYRITYELDVRAQAAIDSTPWTTLLYGSYTPNATANHRVGEFHITTVGARAAGYPVDDPNDPNDFNDLATLDATYDTGVRPAHVDVVTTNVAGAKNPGAHYTYAENTDGTDQMSFTLDGTDLWVQEFRAVSHWLPSGAGRADVTVTAGLATGLSATDCWGADSLPTYSVRAWDPSKTTGDPATCVFSAVMP